MRQVSYQPTAERAPRSLPARVSARRRLPRTAVGLRLARIDRQENLLLCEPMRFSDRLVVDMMLRRARISGHVEIGGCVENHFADVLDADGDIVETVALDRHSYSALKNRWMRCRVDRSFV